jgi:hypothetical protein
MIYTGVGSHRNLKAHEKIHDGTPHNNIAPEPHDSGQAHIITIQGQDYFMQRQGGPLSGDPYFAGINNKTINVVGELVGTVIFVESWSVAP